MLYQKIRLMLYEKNIENIEVTDHEHAEANDNGLSGITTGECCLSNHNAQDHSH